MVNVPITVAFTTRNAKAINNLIKRLTAVQKRINKVATELAKLNRRVTKVTKQMTTLNRRLKSIKNLFTKNSAAANKFTKALKKITSDASKANTRINRTNKNLETFKARTKQAEQNTKNLNRGLGVSGFFFGFLGAAAGQAARSITNVFTETAKNAAEQLSDINKAILLSGTASKNGLIDPDAKRKEKNFLIFLSTQYPQSLTEIANAYKNVGKALPTATNVRDVTELALKLASIEDIDTDEAAKGIAGIKAIFGDAVDFDKIGDVILNVDTQSKANFNQIIKSMSFAAGAAKALNVEFEDLAAVQGLGIDRIGTAQGGAGRATSRLFESFLEPSVLLNDQLAHLGIQIRDNFGGIRGGIDILRDIRREYNKLLDSGQQVSAELLLEELELEANSKRILRAFAQASDKELKDAFEGVKVTGSLDQKFFDQVKQGQEQLNILKNNINVLRLSLGSGLLQALPQLNKLFSELANDKELTELLSEFGKLLGEEIFEALKDVLKIGKKFLKFLKLNKKLLRPLAKALVAVVIGLHALSVIGPVIGLMFGLTFVTSLLNAGLGATGLAGTLTLVSKKFLRFAAIAAIAGLVIYSVAKTFDIINFQSKKATDGVDKLNDSLENIALLGASGALLGGLVAGIPGAIVGAVVGSSLAVGKALGDVINDAISNLGLTGFTEGSFEYFNWKFEGLTDAIKEAVDNGLEYIRQSFINFVLGPLTLFAPVREAFEKAFSSENIKKLVTAIVEDFTSNLALLLNPLEIIRGTFDAEELAEIGKTAAENLVNAMVSTIDYLKDSIFNAILGTIPVVGDIVKHLSGQGAASTVANENIQATPSTSPSTTGDQGILGNIQGFFDNLFGGDSINQLQETLEDYTPAIQEAYAATEDINSKTIELTESLGIENEKTKLFTGTIIKTDEKTGEVRTSFDNLKKAIDNLTRKINRTQVNIDRNEDGQITGFKLTNGITKADAGYYARSFAEGGIVRSPTLGLVGDVTGGEAIIPLKELPDILRSTNTGNPGNNIQVNLNPTIVIEGNGNDISVEDIKEEIIETLGDQLVRKIEEVI